MSWQVSPTPARKAEVERLRRAAHDGNIDARADCLNAREIYVRRVALGEDAEESEEARAGALLLADDGANLLALCRMVEAALKK